MVYVQTGPGSYVLFFIEVIKVFLLLGIQKTRNILKITVELPG
jgi:hypothetical protein